MGWSGIILLQIYSIPIQNSLKNVKYVSEVAGFVPSICLSIINAVVPIISKKICEYEKWDFQEDLVKQMVWRVYLAKIMNLSVFVIINMEMVAGKTWFWSFPLLSFNTYTAGQSNSASIYDCREDFFAYNFYNQVISDFILKIVVETIMALVNKVKALVLKKPKWKEEYDLADEIVWLLYLQAMIWISILLFPFIAWLSPIIMYILFRYCYFSLRRFKEKPERSSNASVSLYSLLTIRTRGSSS